MSSLKDIIAKDNADVFMDLFEFAAIRNIRVNNKLVNVSCVLDEDVLEDRKSYKSDETDGIFVDRKTLFVKQADLGCRPVFNQRVVIDDVPYFVVKCHESCGMLEIQLEANNG